MWGVMTTTITVAVGVALAAWYRARARRARARRMVAAIRRVPLVALPLVGAFAASVKAAEDMESALRRLRQMLEEPKEQP